MNEPNWSSTGGSAVSAETRTRPRWAGGCYDPLRSNAGAEIWRSQEGPTWKINPKGATIQSSLVVVDVLQKILINGDSVNSSVTWGAEQIAGIMKG